ncbi:MAG TPA: T9SS type A sorting domain-containing protein, partial [Taishania sp.]|nr:T9SS type A sorting domain-containing protein [Taishania sp.]
YKGQLGTELIPGDEVVIEYYISPENSYNIGNIEVALVTHGYRSVEEFANKAFGQAGACHMNVNCPDGLPFEANKRSTILIVSGANGFCSGALVNNTAYDGKPYILTANHCYNNPTAWVFRFNWESADCTNPATSPSFSSVSGAQLKARRTVSDFCLVEITGGLELGTIPASFNAHFSGWDRTGVNPQYTFGIHHPRGDIKKISFDDHESFPTRSTVSGVTSEPNGVWQVQWDRGTTTEPVSSGSPLFDQNRRIIGQLWGGAASCSNLTGKDFYGRFHNSWEPTGSDSTNQLKYWLDPQNTGAIIVDGFENGVIVNNDAALLNPTGVKGTLCQTQNTPKLTLVNTGHSVLTSATIAYGVNGVEDQVFNWTGNLSFLAFEEIELPELLFVNGSNLFSATITSVNGGSDEFAGNNSVSSSNYVMTEPIIVDMQINLDCYASETTWELWSDADELVYQSGPYINNDEGIHNYAFCLSEGCYTFKLKDSYGDGMASCASGNGWFNLTNEIGLLFGQMTEDQADFGSQYEVTFCTDEASINKMTSRISVFPNPSTGIIEWKDFVVEEIHVYDLVGNLVEKQAISAQQKSVLLKNVIEGLYFVEFKFVDGTTGNTKIYMIPE